MAQIKAPAESFDTVASLAESQPSALVAVIGIAQFLLSARQRLPVR
jgi:hypothetical protein